MVIKIDKEKRRPLHYEQSSKLSNELGIITCNLIPVPTKWKALSEEDKEVAFERLNSRFEINLDEDYVKKNYEDLLRCWSRNEHYKPKQRFLNYDSVEDACGNPNLSQENWNQLCDLFEDAKYQERCIKYQVNRSKQTINHNKGSRAFVAARHFLRDETTGNERDRIDFYEDTHYDTKKGWLSSEAESKFHEIKHLKAMSTSEEGTPMSFDDRVDQVLGMKSGYIKGLGHRPKPNSRSSQQRIEQEEASNRMQQWKESIKTLEKAREAENEAYRAQMDAVLARASKYEKFFDSLMASGIIPSTFSTHDRLQSRRCGAQGGLVGFYVKTYGYIIFWGINAKTC